MHACMYTWIHIGNALLHILCMHKLKTCLCQDHTVNALITHCVLQHFTKHLAYIHTFLKMNCFQPWRFNWGNKQMCYGAACFLVGWWACLSWIFCKFLVGAARFVVGAIAATCNPLVTVLRASYVNVSTPFIHPFIHLLAFIDPSWYMPFGYRICH